MSNPFRVPRIWNTVCFHLTVVIVTPFLRILYFPHKPCWTECFDTHSSPVLWTDCLFQELAAEFSGRPLCCPVTHFRGVDPRAEGCLPFLLWTFSSFWKIRHLPNLFPCRPLAPIILVCHFLFFLSSPHSLFPSVLCVNMIGMDLLRLLGIEAWFQFCFSWPQRPGWMGSSPLSLLNESAFVSPQVYSKIAAIYS